MRRLSIPDPNKVVLALRQEIVNSPDTRYLHRAHGVLLVAQGVSCYKVARWFGEDPRTVERWVHHFDRAGLEGLREAAGPGRRSKFAIHEATLRGDIRDSPRHYGYDKDSWNGGLLADHLRRRYEIALSVRQCQRILKHARS